MTRAEFIKQVEDLILHKDWRLEDAIWEYGSDQPYHPYVDRADVTPVAEAIASLLQWVPKS